MISRLNPQQQEAVLHFQGPALILAGAGSGKTRVVVHRIVHLVQNRHVNPWNILAVTFTNKAANEMKHRIMELIPACNGMTIGTFHSICARILRREHQHVNLIANFTIADDSQKIARIKKAIAELGFDIKKFVPRDVSGRISKAKNLFQSPDDMESDAGFNIYLKSVAKIYRLYQAQLIRDHAVDFDDLIIRVVRLFEENVALRTKYQDRFKFIMVDEYQDTNHAQYRLIKVLAQRYGNLMVVGDDDQSIYRWRGAEVSNILNFSRDFPGAVVIKLEQNYRSTGVILGAASALMKNNRNRSPKTLWTDKDEGEKIIHFQVNDDREEVSCVLDIVKKLVKSGAYSFRDIVIFYRTNAQSRVIEEMCMSRRVPHRVIGQVGFFNRKEVKDLLAYIRISLNPSDSTACMRIINNPRRGIGRKTQLELMKVARENEIDVFSALEKVIDNALLNKFKLQRLVKFRDMVHELIRVARTSSVSEYIRSLFALTGYPDQFEFQESIEAKASLEIINEFESAANDFSRQNDQGLDAFADYLALNQNNISDSSDKSSDNREFISLMTLHNSKGLEFPVVFILGMEEGLCPHFYEGREISQADLEEERRLIYVGMTRAMQRLFLISASRRFRFGKYVSSDPSRFLKEIPQEFIEHQYLHPPDSYPANSSFAYAKNIHSARKKEIVVSHPNFASELRPGDRVKHRSWGNGTVLRFQGSGPSAKVQVSFDRAGIKRLVYGPSRLMKLNK